MREEDSPIEEYPDGISHQSIGDNYVYESEKGLLAALSMPGAWLGLVVLAALGGILFMAVMLVVMLFSGVVTF